MLYPTRSLRQKSDRHLLALPIWDSVLLQGLILHQNHSDLYILSNPALKTNRPGKLKYVNDGDRGRQSTLKAILSASACLFPVAQCERRTLSMAGAQHTNSSAAWPTSQVQGPRPEGHSRTSGLPGVQAYLHLFHSPITSFPLVLPQFV